MGQGGSSDGGGGGSDNSGSRDNSNEQTGNSTTWSQSGYNTDHSSSGRCATSQADTNARFESAASRDNPYEQMGAGITAYMSQQTTNELCK